MTLERGAGGTAVLKSPVPTSHFEHGLQQSLVAQTVKNLPGVWETQVRSLDGEDPLQKEMATHSSILVWKTP